MAYLLDTCLISEFFKKEPEAGVMKWFAEQLPASLYISVLTFGEIKKGVLRLPPSKKRESVSAWIDEAKLRYDRRVLGFDLATAEIWARIRAETEAFGTPLSMIDSLIAATAIEHQLTIVTRNVKDFERSGAETLDPWKLK